jgi:hypothetical protein
MHESIVMSSGQGAKAAASRIVMIPEFNDDGYLPPGIHPATLDEIAARFGQENELRKVQMESLRWLVDAAKRARVQRIIVNGSFVTETFEPNDVDCVLLMKPGFTPDKDAEEELLEGLPFIALMLVEQDDFDFLVDTFLATDRKDIPKGMIEVIL